MPVDFDDDDISDVIQETEKQAQTPRYQEVANPIQDFDDQMSEVEKRLEMAQYYRLVLNDTIFNDPPNPEVADRVENEIREFVRSRMALLVGVGSEPKKVAETVSSFSEEETLALRTLAQAEVVSALKALAAKVLKKPAILDAKPRPTEVKPKSNREPTLRKIVRTSPAATTPEAQTPRGARTPPYQAKGKGKRQDKVFKTVINEQGEEVKMDITPQAKPVGVTPFPTPQGRNAVEMHSAQSARQQAMVAVSSLERMFSGK